MRVLPPERRRPDELALDPNFHCSRRVAGPVALSRECHNARAIDADGRRRGFPLTGSVTDRCRRRGGNLTTPRRRREIDVMLNNYSFGSPTLPSMLSAARYDRARCAPTLRLRFAPRRCRLAFVDGPALRIWGSPGPSGHGDPPPFRAGLQMPRRKKSPQRRWLVAHTA